MLLHRILAFLCLCLIFPIGFAACGKYAPPLPPEVFAPQAVKYLEVLPQLKGVLFKWEAPNEDLRAKELKEIDGYFIYRKEILKKSDLVDDEEEFEIITTIVDTHIKLRDQMRKEAQQAGMPARKIRVEPELRNFEYLDENLEAGHKYLYKIVPFNQGDVEGQVLEVYSVLFRGTASEVKLVDKSDFDTLS